MQCPPGLAATPDAGDFCLDLQGLDYGRQYEAEVVYALKGQKRRWSRRGTPLYFILVDSAEEAAAVPGLNAPDEAPLPSTGVALSQPSVQPLDGPRSLVRWRASGNAVGDVRAYQVRFLV